MDASLFRLVLDQGPRIEVQIHLDGRVCAGGVLTQMHEKGATIRFPRVCAPALYLAQASELRFTAVPAKGTVALHARVSLRRDVALEREYHFIFRSPQEVEQNLAPWLRTISNRRASARVRLLLPTPVRVIIESPLLKSRVVATLADVSDGGLSAQVSLEEEELLLRVETAQVSFVLPSTPADQISLAAKILERRLTGSRALIVVVFVPERTAHFREQEEAIRRFVNEHSGKRLKRA